MKQQLLALTASVSFLAPALANAQEFGRKGDAVFSAERLMGITGTHQSTEVPALGDVEVDVTEFSFALRPTSPGPFTVPRIAFDYLIIDHLSLGGSLGYASYSPDEGADQSAFMFAPRVGYAYAFGRVVAIWPRAGLTYHSASVDDGDSENGLALTIECPFTFSPTEHFAFHVGPTFDIDMFGTRDPGDAGPDVDRTYRSFGINAGILGWL